MKHYYESYDGINWKPVPAARVVDQAKYFCRGSRQEVARLLSLARVGPVTFDGVFSAWYQRR